MPTGGGKSLCYQLPGLATEDLTVVVSPLIALMNDQWLRLSGAGHPVTMIASGMSEEAARGALDMVRSGEARIVYCSPERFGSHGLPRRPGAAAHRPARRRRGPLRLRVGPRLPPRLPAPAADRRPARPADGDGLHGDGDRDGRRRDRDPLRHARPARSSAPASTGPTSPSTSSGSKGRARRRGARPCSKRASPTRATAPRSSTAAPARTPTRSPPTCAAAGFGAAPYHAGMDAEERTATQRRFMAGEVEVIVATNAFGMGVDKADVRSVWHMAIPTSVEAYYQEAGRAGRDGLPAKAVLLAMRSDLGRLVRFNEQRSPDQEIARERGWRAYRVIKSFIYSDRCRRRQLLDHFSDRTAGAPLGRCCDVCDPERWLPDPETIAVSRRRSSKASAPPPELAAARRAPIRRAQGVAPGGRGRQAGLHRRPQQDAGARSPPPGPRTPPASPRSAASARASSPSTRRRCWRSSPRTPRPGRPLGPAAVLALLVELRLAPGRPLLVELGLDLRPLGALLGDRGLGAPLLRPARGDGRASSCWASC